MKLDRQAVRRQFGRAAASYDANAVVQYEVGKRLRGRLDGLRFEPSRVLDLGCGTGTQSRALHQRYPDAQIVALDSAPAMLARAQKQRGRWRRRFECIQADAEALPLAEAGFDLVFSNLMLQWCDQPQRVLAAARRVLRPGGLLLVSTFGLDTLRELRRAWAKVDDRVRVSHFTDVQGFGSALTQAGFAEPVLDTDWFTTTYARPGDLIRELKAIGATNAMTQRARGLTPPRALQAMLRHYELFRQADGRYPATWEVVYASAWAPDDGQPIRTERGELASVPISRIGRRQR